MQINMNAQEDHQGKLKSDQKTLGGSRSTSLSLKHILVGDDEPTARKLLGMVLEDYYKVTTCGSVDEAEQALEESEFDLVVSDYLMPDKTGIDLANFIKVKKLFITLILITGHGAEEVEKMAMAAGVSVILAKPIDEKLLIETIDGLLEKKSNDFNV